MSTNKEIKIQKNKILTYSVNKVGFKTVYGTEVVSENKTINVNMVNINDVDPDKPFKLGDRLFGISSFVDYFTPSGTYDVDSLKYLKISQTTGTSLSNLAVVKATWLSQVEQTLSVETPKGSSNTFVFTFDGTNWNLSGATTQSNVDLEDYGISFDGTAVSGDVITVVETQYNKFAFFVLDANYRSQNLPFSTANDDLSPYVNSYNEGINPNDYAELCSATHYDFVINNYFNISNYPDMSYCKNLGSFILNDNIKLNPLLPNTKELYSIYTNKNILDTFDPVTIANPSAQFNLTSWTFSYDGANSCVPTLTGWNMINCLKTDGNWNNIPSQGKYGTYKDRNEGVVPIFEVPVM